MNYNTMRQMMPLKKLKICGEIHDEHKYSRRVVKYENLGENLH